MKKKVLTRDQAHGRLAKGVNIIANAVASTLGPRGQNVVIEKETGEIGITKDGVTVANQIYLQDPVENMGAQLMKQVAQRTVETVGDGTTTSTVLARSIYINGLKNIAAGANPMDLKIGIDLAVTKAVDWLKSYSKEISGIKDMQSIARISANNDPEIGDMIAKALKAVGQDGSVTVEPSTDANTTMRVVDGMRWDEGWRHQSFLTDQSRNECVLIDPMILIINKRINSNKEIIPIMQKCSEMAGYKGRPFLFICDDIDEEPLQTLVMNKVQGNIKAAAVRAPWYQSRYDGFEDIAIYTGGTMVADTHGRPLEKFEPSWIGTADKVVITDRHTTIYGAKGSVADIEKRIAQLKAQREVEDITPSKKALINQRLARLSGGIAVISIGGSSEVEQLEKRDRFEDALFATRAAVEEGIVPGGGTALLRISDMLESQDMPALQDIRTGYWLILNAMREPFNTILRNGNLAADSIRVDVLKSKAWGVGYDARLQKRCDLIKRGVIDPTKVVRLCLENAASISGLLLTSNNLIHIIPGTEEARAGKSVK